MQVHIALASRARNGPLGSRSGAPVDVAAAHCAHDAKQAVLGARQVPQRVRPPRDLRIEPGASQLATPSAGAIKESAGRAAGICTGRVLAGVCSAPCAYAPSSACLLPNEPSAPLSMQVPEFLPSRPHLVPPCCSWASLHASWEGQCHVGPRIHALQHALALPPRPKYMRLLQLPHPGHAQQHGLLRWLRHH